jgi:hypothetical protein
MPDFGDLLAQGMLAQVPKIQNASRQMALTLAQNGAPPQLRGVPSGSPGGLFAGSLTENTDNRVVDLLAQILATLATQRDSGRTVNMQNTIHTGGTNAQQLYNRLMEIGGHEFEDFVRGGFNII